MSEPTAESTSNKIRSRSQQDLESAYIRVKAVADEYAEQPGDTPENRKENERRKKVRDTYGGLCHSFPILILRDGLCQSLAFYESKSAKSVPHGLALSHVRQIIETTEPGDLSKIVAGLDLSTYLRATSRLLDAWIYHKRFAESILDVGSAADVEGDD